MKVGFGKLSKTISHALRHEPELYNLNVDTAGWVDLTDLVASLKNNGWQDIAEYNIIDMVQQATKKRHEIIGNRIRAYYGHTIVEEITRKSEEPPILLYHGTIIDNLDNIKGNGLLPMERNYVHLAANYEDAQAVSARKGSKCVILIIDAGVAYKNGVNFYREQNAIWLTETVPIKYIKPWN